jgi:DNA-binding NarL/FixJ family response regulator
VDLLPIFSNNRRRYPSAASWVLSSEIRLSAGCASARRLMLLGFFGLALNKQRLAFMVTTEQDALEGLARARPGLLIASNQLEQGSGLALVEQARALVEDIRTILIVDAQQDDLVAAGQSSADAVLAEADCFTEDKPVIALSRSLSLGRRYRSASVQAALEAAAFERAPWRDE